MADRRVRAWVVLLVVLLLGGGSAWLATPPRPSPDDAAARSTQAAPASSPPAAADPSARPARQAPAPLPGKDAPLSTIAVQLDALAAAGDTRAACRLAVELLRCAEIADLMDAVARQDAQPDPENAPEPDDDLEQAAHAADEDIWRIRQREQCDLLPPSLREQAWPRLRGAALAGEPEAMLRYANSAPIGMGVGNAFLGHTGFNDWRREAPAMVRRLFRSGDHDAGLLLMLSSSHDMDPLSGLMGGDRQTMLAYRLLFWRMRADAPPPPPTSAYSAAEVETAMRQAETWHRDHFGNRLFPRRTDFGKLAPLSWPNPKGPAPCET